LTRINYRDILSLVIEKGGCVKNKKFNKLWQKLLELQPTNEDLSRIIYAVEPLRKKAFQQLLKQNPANWRIRDAISYESLKEEAAQQLLKRDPNNEDLIWIILYVESSREEAWKLFLKQDPENKYLVRIICRVESLNNGAWDQLLKQGIRLEDLNEIPLIKSLIEEASEIRKRAEARHEIVQKMNKLIRSSP